MSQVEGSEGGHAWREVFQSSPAPLSQLTDEQFQVFAERLGIPAAFAEQLRAKPLTGTVRFRFPISDAGSKVRLRLSNEEGTTPVVIASASAGLRGKALAGLDGSLRPVTFGARPGITIPAGSPAVSDPIDLTLAADTELIVSVSLPGEILVGGFGHCPIEVAPGDQTMVEKLEHAKGMVVRPFVTGISVLTSQTTRVIGALGDSLTDANCAETHSWPERLHRRLAARSASRSYSVANAGIGGNRLLAPGMYPEMGIAGLARLERDILRIDGLTHMILLEGTNDIGMSGHTALGTNPAIAVEDLVAGYRQVIARAGSRGVKVVLGTLLPFGGSSQASRENEGLRQSVNDWIRSSGEPDGVIDFDAALRDPADRSCLRAAYDLGDHLHLNGAGCEAMAEAVDLAIFD